MRDPKQLVVLLFFDIKKDFDGEPRNILDNTIQLIEVTSLLLQWVNFFSLTDTKSVKLTLPPTTNGVVQGGFLRPLRFTVNINNTCRYSNTDKIHLYANDLTVVYETYICNVRRMRQAIHELNKADNWGLEPNTEKCSWPCIETRLLKEN